MSSEGGEAAGRLQAEISSSVSDSGSFNAGVESPIHVAGGCRGLPDSPAGLNKPGCSSDPPPASSREVSWQESGGLQIQLSNIGVNHEGGGGSSCEVSATDDEDEETLRMMVLQTLQKKPRLGGGGGGVSPTKQSSSMSVVVHQADSQQESGRVGTTRSLGSRRTVVMKGKMSGDRPGDFYEEEEEICGEWMVLDEVLDEGSDKEDGKKNRLRNSRKVRTVVTKEGKRKTGTDASGKKEGNKSENETKEADRTAGGESQIEMDDGKDLKTVDRPSLNTGGGSDESADTITDVENWIDKLTAGNNLKVEGEREESAETNDVKTVVESGGVGVDKPARLGEQVGAEVVESAKPTPGKRKRKTVVRKKVAGNVNGLRACRVSQRQNAFDEGSGASVASPAEDSKVAHMSDGSIEAPSAPQPEDSRSEGFGNEIQRLEEEEEEEEDKKSESTKSSTVSVAGAEEQEEEAPSSLKVEPASTTDLPKTTTSSDGDQTTPVQGKDADECVDKLEGSCSVQQQSQSVESSTGTKGDEVEEEKKKEEMKVQGCVVAAQQAEQSETALPTVLPEVCQHAAVQPQQQQQQQKLQQSQQPQPKLAQNQQRQTQLQQQLQKQKLGQTGKEGKTVEPMKTKRLLILKRIEQAYSDKRMGMNKVITQLASLVEEATDEERQRQSLRHTIAQLRQQLGDMEGQLEVKSGTLKKKMARIRSLQTQITTDRELIAELERKGTLVGRQEYGISYILPKVLESPQSKTNDTYRKKKLASSIDALRQQMRDVSKKNRAELQQQQQRGPRATDRGDATGRDITAAKSNSTEPKPLRQQQQQQQQTSTQVKASQPVVKALFTTTMERQASGASSNMSQNVAKVVTSKVSSSGGVVTQVGRGNNTVSGGGVKRLLPQPDQQHHPASKAAKLEEGTQDMQKCQEQGVKARVEGEAMPKEGRTHSRCPAEEGEKRLDEMSELCPYDLLGRCNDDSCTYQHLANPRMVPSRASQELITHQGTNHSSVPEKLATCAKTTTSTAAPQNHTHSWSAGEGAVSSSSTPQDTTTVLVKPSTSQPHSGCPPPTGETRLTGAVKVNSGVSETASGSDTVPGGGGRGGVGSVSKIGIVSVGSDVGIGESLQAGNGQEVRERVEPEKERNDKNQDTVGRSDQVTEHLSTISQGDQAAVSPNINESLKEVHPNGKCTVEKLGENTQLPVNDGNEINGNMCQNLSSRESLNKSKRPRDDSPSVSSDGAAVPREEARYVKSKRTRRSTRSSEVSGDFSSQSPSSGEKSADLSSGVEGTSGLATGSNSDQKVEGAVEVQVGEVMTEVDCPESRTSSSSQETQVCEVAPTIEAKGQKPTEAKGEKPTEAEVEKPTEAEGGKPTEAEGEKPTEAEGQKPTEAEGEKPTEAEGEKPTEAEGEKPTEKDSERPDAQGETAAVDLENESVHENRDESSQLAEQGAADEDEEHVHAGKTSHQLLLRDVPPENMVPSEAHDQEGSASQKDQVDEAPVCGASTEPLASRDSSSEDEPLAKRRATRRASKPTRGGISGSKNTVARNPSRSGVRKAAKLTKKQCRRGRSKKTLNNPK